MKLRKIVFVIGLMAIFAMLTSGSPVWAGGGGPEPGEGADIHGPELWGVVILDCTNHIASLRVKGIENCLVFTQAFVQTGWGYGCSDDPTAPLDWALEGITFLDSTGEPFPGTPFITKVKNFNRDLSANLLSFDAQFKFYD